MNETQWAADYMRAHNFKIPEKLRAKPSLEFIKAHVAIYFQVDPELMVGNNRKPDNVAARMTGMYLSRVITNKSFRDIALVFKRKDHTTAMHAYDTTLKRVQSDDFFARQVRKMADLIMDSFTQYQAVSQEKLQEAK